MRTLVPNSHDDDDSTISGTITLLDHTQEFKFSEFADVRFVYYDQDKNIPTSVENSHLKYLH